MEASRSDNIKKAFVLKADDLSAIQKVVREFLRSNGKITFDLVCKDGMERHPDDLKSVANYDNSEKSQIVKLTVSGVSEDRVRRCTIVLSNDSFWDNIRVSANGGEQSVSTFFEGLTTTIQNMVPWYGRFAVINFISLFFSIIGFLSIAITILGIGLALANGTLQNLTKTTGNELVIVICVFGYSLLAGQALNWVRQKLFPIAVFAIGAGLRRHEISDWWRKLIISTVLIGGVVVGGSVNFIVNMITK